MLLYKNANLIYFFLQITNFLIINKKRADKIRPYKLFMNVIV